MTDKELDEFIEDAERRRTMGDEWWLDDFFEEAGTVGKELREARKAAVARAMPPIDEAY